MKWRFHLIVCLLTMLCSLPETANAADFPVPPVKTSLRIEDEPVTVVVSGFISMTPTAQGQSIAVKADADLSDLQEKILPILRAQLNQDNRCGDRLHVDRATLAPEAPAGLLTAEVHYEKWGCAKAFGKEIVKKLVGGNAVVRVRLTPVVDTPGAVHLRAEVLAIDADGQLGELLRSGSFGAALQEKLRKSLARDLEKSSEFQAALPASVQNMAAIRAAEFSNSGEGRLRLTISGEVQVSAEQAAKITEQLKALAR